MRCIKKNKFKSTNIITIFVDLIFISVLIILNTSSLFIKSIEAVWVVNSLIYIFLIWTTTKFFKYKINYFTIFILLTYIYHLGQHLTYTFGWEISTQYTILNTYDISVINKIVMYATICVIILHASVCFFCGKDITYQNKTMTSSVKAKKMNILAIKITSIILFAVSFPSTVMVLVFKIKLLKQFGYSIALNSNFDSLGSFSYIVNFFYTLMIPAIVLALVAFKDSRWKVIFFIFTGVYIILYFSSGSRYQVVVFLMGLIIIFHYYYKKIKVKNALITCIIGYLLIFICSIMSEMRILMNHTSYSFAEIIIKSIDITYKSNIFSKVLSITGQQIITITTVFEHCPNDINYSYGLYYLMGIARIIPNIFGGENKLITDSIDTMFHIYFTKSYGMGSSFIAEAYYNFGYLLVFVMIFYGFLIERLCRYTIKYTDENNVFGLYVCFYFTCTTFFYVRSDARFLLRGYIFYCLSIFIIVKIVQNIFIKNSKVEKE